MAESTLPPDDEEKLKKKMDLINCGICLNPVQNPKSLPCLHSFCFGCIEEWAKEETNHINCPVCKDKFPLPKGGVAEFKGNFYINRLKKVREMKKEVAEKITCRCCEMPDNVAVAQCMDCDGHYLCTGCVQTHKTFKPLQGHKVYSLEDIQTGEVDIEKLSIKEYCSKHDNQVKNVLWFYCETCGDLICRDCSVVDHPALTHKLVNLEEVSGTHTQDLSVLSHRCQEVVEQVNQAMKAVNDVETDLDKILSDAQMEVKNNAQKIKECFLANLKKKEKYLLDQIDEIGEEHKTYIKLDRDSLQSQHLQLERALAVTAHVTEKGSPYDLAAMYTTLTDTMQRLVTMEPCIIDQSLNQMTFEPNILIHVEAPTIGTITDDHKLKVQCELTGIWSQKSQICDNSGLQNGIKMSYYSTGDIIIADHSHSDLKVFSEDGGLKQNIDVKLDSSKSQPSGIVTSPSDLIFVSDESPYVKVFDLTTNLTYKFQAVPPENAEELTKTSSLAGIAMTYDRNIIVGDSSGKYISIHKQSGDHVASFTVNMKPWFISAAPRKDVIVVSNCGGHLTHILNSAGQVLHTLTGAPFPGKAWKPTGACFNGDDEFLIASQSDWGKPGGIYHFTTDGSYLGCITDDVGDPTDVAITKEGKILVLEHTHIKVFIKK